MVPTEVKLAQNRRVDDEVLFVYVLSSATIQSLMVNCNILFRSTVLYADWVEEL